MRRHRPAHVLLAIAWALVAVGIMAVDAGAASPVAGAASPAGYRTPAEVRAAVAALQAEHPEIVQVSTIGRSYQGRPIQVVKVSDNVRVDENEPEVFVNARVHAREHVTVEQALGLLHWLADGYAGDPAIRSIVDSTEIWVVPDANPDGAAFDLSGSHVHLWRKDRQPNKGSGTIGTDINRNFGYHWGGKGSSANPAADIYRGPHAFSTPEARALRDFVLSRRVGGVQQIRLALSLHSFGEDVLYPYGYTHHDIGAGMTLQQHAVEVALARGIATRNGYTPMQEASLYLTSGTLLDWAFGAEGIYTLTVELSPPTPGGGGFYPKPSSTWPWPRSAGLRTWRSTRAPMARWCTSSRSISGSSAGSR